MHVNFPLFGYVIPFIIGISIISATVFAYYQLTTVQNQILKSTITIYEVDKLTDDQFKTILRHELGHVIGLAHSTAPEDLMAPTIQTQYPYISDCDIDSIVKLYDGGKKSQVTCEK